jgi:hypothetical protein
MLNGEGKFIGEHQRASWKIARDIGPEKLQKSADSRWNIYSQ